MTPATPVRPSVTPPSARLAAGTAAHDDRRVHPRQDGHFDLWLLDPDGETVLRCRADNISATGAHAVAPATYNLQKGQRYRLQVCPASPWTGFGDGTRLLGDVTVVRTERLIGEDDDHIGAGLAFDRPVTWNPPAIQPRALHIH